MVGDMTEKKLEIDGEKDYSKRYEVQKKNNIWNSPRSMAKYDGKKGDSMDENPGTSYGSGDYVDDYHGSPQHCGT